jgi:hypothetical protein
MYYHPKTQFRYFFHHPSRLLTDLDILDASLSDPVRSVYAVVAETTHPIPEGWEQVFNPPVEGWESTNRLYAVWKPGRFFVDHDSRTLTPTDPRTVTTMPVNRESIRPWRGGRCLIVSCFAIDIIWFSGRVRLSKAILELQFSTPMSP